MPSANKRRSPTSIQSLEGVKAFIIEQFVGKGLTGKALQKILLREKKIDRTQLALRKWGVRKTLSGQEWKSLLTQYDLVKSNSPEIDIKVRISGYDVDSTRLERARDRYASLPDAMAGCPAGVSIGRYSNNCWIELHGPKSRLPPSSSASFCLLPEEVGPRLPADVTTVPTDALICRRSSDRLSTTRLDVLSFLRGLGILDLDLFDSCGLRGGVGIRIGPASIESLLLNSTFVRFISQVEPQIQSFLWQAQICPGTLFGPPLEIQPTKLHALGRNPEIGAGQYLQEIRSILPDSLISAGSLPSDVSPTAFFRLITYSLANGFAGMTSMARKSLMNSLRMMPGLGEAIARSLYRSQDPYARAMSETLFQAAVELADCATVDVLLNKRLVDVNKILFRVDEHPETFALGRAAWLGEATMVKTLLLHGADPDAKVDQITGVNGPTALRLLLSSGRNTPGTIYTIAEHLLNAKAFVSQEDLHGMFHYPETRPLGFTLIRNASVCLSRRYLSVAPEMVSSLENEDPNLHALLAKKLVSVAEAGQRKHCNCEICQIPGKKVSPRSVIEIAVRCGSWEETNRLLSVPRIIRPITMQTCILKCAKRRQLRLLELLLNDPSSWVHLVGKFEVSDHLERSKEVGTSLYGFSILVRDAELASLLENRGAITSDECFGFAWLAAVQVGDTDRLQIFKTEGHIHRYLEKLNNNIHRRGQYLSKAIEAALTQATTSQDEEMAQRVLSIAIQTGMPIKDGFKCLSASAIWRWPEVLKGFWALSSDMQPEQLFTDKKWMSPHMQLFCLRAMDMQTPEAIEFLEFLEPALKGIPPEYIILAPQGLAEFLQEHDPAKLGPYINHLILRGFVNNSTLNALFAYLVQKYDENAAAVLYGILSCITEPWNLSLKETVRARKHDLLDSLLKKCPLTNGCPSRNFGTSSLIIAIQQKPMDMRLVEMLLDCPAIDIYGSRSMDWGRVNCRPSKGYDACRYPLKRTAYNGNDEEVDLPETVLKTVMQTIQVGGLNCLDLVRRLFDQAPDQMRLMHQVFFLESQHEDRVTTHFLEAIGSGHEPLVRVFIDRGAEVNHFPMSARHTPLQRAASEGHLEVVELLLKKGADVNALPALQKGKTALQGAAASGSLSVAIKLLEHGADLYMAPAAVEGAGPLEAAAMNSRFDMIDLLWNASKLCGRRFDQFRISRAIELAEDRGYHGCADRLQELAEAWLEGEVAPGLDEDFRRQAKNSPSRVSEVTDADIQEMGGLEVPLWDREWMSELVSLPSP